MRNHTSDLPQPHAPGRVRELVWFFLLVFAITWGIAALVLFQPALAERLTGPFSPRSPLFFAAVYAPLMSAVLCTVLFRGAPALAELLRSYFRRAHWGWWLASIVLFPGAWLAAAIAMSAWNAAPSIDFALWWSALPVAIASGRLLTDPGPIGEELGWRGYALPRLLERMSAMRSSLVLGTIWGIWHLPSFFVGSPDHTTTDIFWFVSMGVAATVLMTFLYVNANGNVTVAGVLPHLLLNACLATGIAGIDAAAGMSLWALVVLVWARCGSSLRWTKHEVSAPVPDRHAVPRGEP